MKAQRTIEQRIKDMPVRANFITLNQKDVMKLVKSNMQTNGKACFVGFVCDDELVGIGRIEFVPFEIPVDKKDISILFESLTKVKNHQGVVANKEEEGD